MKVLKILIIEDDDNKCSEIESYLKKTFYNISLKYGKSYQSGIQEAINERYDLLLLDMSIPNFDINENEDGGSTLKNGGELIIMELIDENVDFKCVVLTQYETFNDETLDAIDTRLKENCGSKYLGCIRYSAWKNDWKELLKNIIQNL